MLVRCTFCGAAASVNSRRGRKYVYLFAHCSHCGKSSKETKYRERVSGRHTWLEAA